MQWLSHPLYTRTAITEGMSAVEHKYLQHGTARRITTVILYYSALYCALFSPAKIALKSFVFLVWRYYYHYAFILCCIPNQLGSSSGCGSTNLQYIVEKGVNISCCNVFWSIVATIQAISNTQYKRRTFTV